MKAIWSMVSLGEVLKISLDAAAIEASSSYNIAGVYSFGRGLFKRGPISGSDTTYKVFHRLHKDSLVMSNLKAWEGAIARVTKDYEGWFLSPQFTTFDVFEDRIDVRYLEWYCKRSLLWEELRLISRGMGARRDSVHPERFLSIKIPLPPLPEQQRIAAKIEALAAKIVEANSLRHKAAEESEALVTSLHVNIAGKRVRELREVVLLDEEAVPVKPGEEYPQVGIKSFGTGLFKKSATKGADTTYKAFNRLYPGALVLSQVKGWEGAIAVAGDDFAGWFVSPEYRTFRCIDGEASPDYLSALVRTEWFWGRLQTATRGVGARRERTRPEQFLHIKIPMPDLDHQKSAVAVFKMLEALKGPQSQTAAELDALLPAILDRAFKGEL